MSKKRRLSPTASSRSSATPAPVQIAVPDGSPLKSALDPGSSPVAEPALGVPGPSRLSASLTPAPAVAVERALARHGVSVLGSGDGSGPGDECFLWDGLPMNKQAFRYAPCGISPNPSPAPVIPFYRTIPYAPPTPDVHISWLDRSPFLRLSADALTAMTDRGFRAARANVAVREGSWYYEVIVERGNGVVGGAKGSAGDPGNAGNAHIRVGWGRREASLDAPVGSDGYSYGIRDVGGEKLHLSRPKPYGRSFSSGDVVGCLITLPSRPKPSRGPDPADTSLVYRRRVPIHYKGQWYFEMSEYLPAKEMDVLVDREGKLAAAKAAAEAAKAEEVNGRKKKGATTKHAKKGKKEVVEPSAPVARELPRLQGSRVEFFLNGEPLGTAFDEIYDFLPLPPLNPQQTKRHGVHHFDPQKDLLHDDGTLGYYPMVSCFGRGKLRCNFGPKWVKPPAALSARAMSERWSEFRDEERELDEADEEEAAERMRMEMEEDEKRKATMEAKLAKAGAKKKSAASASSAKRKKGTATPTPGPEGLSRAGTPKSEARTPRPEGTPVKLEIESARATPAPSTPGARGGSVSRAGSVGVSRAGSVGVSRTGSVSVSRAGSVASMRHEEAGDESKMDVDEEEGVTWD
ncbi:hypothetical protein JCM24511_01931 [Saitozyma sp. JCM 24511]|nr:hypothetical protein JCM24511_01931 [Saitozyma sp. JCM 24511]